MTITTNLTVNDAVFAKFNHYGRRSIRKGTVASISPTGVARCVFTDDTISFNRQGDMRGTRNSFHVSGHLINEAEYRDLLADVGASNRRAKVREAIKEAAAITVDASNREALITALNAAIDAVEAL